MSKQGTVYLALFAALLASTAWAAWPAPKTAGCCEAGADCCFPGSPCCAGDCCTEGAPCCYPGSPCCDGDCCQAGAACCEPAAACCLAVSADVQKASKAEAAPAGSVTVIAVEDMDCPSCAKKIVARLNQVAGVARVVADTAESKLSVTPKEKASPSAKALWQAVEQAGFKPTRLEGPAGKFTTLPKE